MKYSPHIDGLRAIAITLVLLFHAGIQGVPSGYVGVDIFFVISGFLITRIIHNSLNKQSFSFTEFYARRLWRLQPALLSMVLVTTCVTFLLFLPEDLIQYNKSANKSLLFTSNQFFSRLTAGYFAPESNQLPLLHTWSLSVEWQCYFILPILLYLLHRFSNALWFCRCIYLLTLLTMSWSLYLSGHNEHTYYQFSSRFFEFLIGSSVALGAYPFIRHRWVLELLTTLSFMIVFYLALLPGVQNGFPNGYAILLCFATALLIIAGEQRYQSVGIRLISQKPIVFIGLISYSLYLWHWPILGLLHYLDVAITPWVMVWFFTSLLALSYCSWRFIEKPARKWGKLSFSYSLAYLFIIPCLVLHSSYFFIKKYEGFPTRFPEATAFFAGLKDYESQQRVACLVFKSGQVNSECVFGAHDLASKKAFLFGDSFSNHYWRFLEVFANQANISFTAHAIGSCLALPDIQQFFGSKIHQECFNQTQRYYEMIKENHYDYVVIGESWQGYLDDRVVMQADDKRSSELSRQRIENALDKAITLITASGAKPILLKDIALNKTTNPYQCFIKHIKQRAPYQEHSCNYPINISAQKWRNSLFNILKKKHPQLMIIDPQKVLCTKELCFADINNLPVFRDKAHLTDYASYQLAQQYIEHYSNPFLNQG